MIKVGDNRMQKHIKKILIIELLAFIAFLAMCFMRGKNSNTVIDAPLETWATEYLAFGDDCWYVEDWGSELEKPIDLLYGPYVYLEKGDYTISIEYECEENQSFEPYAYKKNTSYIKGESAILDKSSNLTTYQFRVTEDIDNFEVRVFYNGKGDFTIHNIVIERNQNDIKRSIIYALLLCTAVNIVCFCYVSSVERRKYLLSILGITFFISLPLFYTGLNDGGIMDPGGQDMIFHLMRIEGLVKELRCGNFPVRVSSAWMAEYGYPASIYYGDILLYLPALLRIFGFSITEAYKCYVIFINLLTVLIAEYSFRKIFHKRNLALLLTLVYSTAAYRLVDVYIRAAVGEYTAIMFMPLIALAIYNIYSDDNHTLKNNLKNATLLAIGMSGIITSHVLTAEMVVVVLALVCLLFVRKTTKITAIRTYVIAVTETILLCAGFLVPFLDYYVNVPVNITNIVEGEIAKAIQKDGAAISDYFAFFNNPFGDWNTMLFNPGVVLMLALGIAAIFWYKNAATKKMKALTILSVMMLFLASNLFPWDNLAHDHKIFNLLAQVQFPWRYIGIAIVFMTLLLGFILEHEKCEEILKSDQKKLIGVTVSVVFVMTCVFVSYYADYAQRTEFYDAANIDSYHMMGAEYLRTGTDVEAFDGKISADGTEFVEIVSRVGCSMDITAKNGSEETMVILPILNYKGYVVTDNLGNQYEISDSENNLISFVLPENFEGNLYLRFEEPWYWTTALGISGVTLLVIAAGGFFTKRKKEINGKG